MSKRILVPVDGSEQSRAAVDFTMKEFPDSTFTLLHVINPANAGYSVQASFPTFSEEWYERQKGQAEDLFEKIEADAENYDVAVEHDIEIGKPTHKIVEYAEEHDIDQIVMGSHGRSGVSRILLGSVAETVVRRSPVPITVVR